MDTEKKLRVAVFTSFLRGIEIINDLTTEKAAEKIELVGVVTDNPALKMCSASKRFWKYLSDEERESYVNKIKDLADEKGLPFYDGRIKGQDESAQKFVKMLKEEWKPDIVYVGSFGQLVDEKILNIPKYGICNTHPTSDQYIWPHFQGGDPFEQMIGKKEPHCNIALHKMTIEIDAGELIKYSERVPIPASEPEKESVINMHKLTAKVASQLVLEDVMGRILPAYAKDHLVLPNPNIFIQKNVNAVAANNPVKSNNLE